MSLGLIVAAAAGLVAGAATDLLLAGAGVATIDGLQAGVIAAPLLVAVISRRARRELASHPALALVALGTTWTLAPLIDQHLTQVVVVDGAAPDLIHHAAGWLALLAAARLIHRPIGSITS
jgi:hypothetical protein